MGLPARATGGRWKSGARGGNAVFKPDYWSWDLRKERRASAEGVGEEPQRKYQADGDLENLENLGDGDVGGMGLVAGAGLRPMARRAILVSGAEIQLVAVQDGGKSGQQTETQQ